MGNSPSRSELHGEHMSNIGNNTGQETFQSHSYPTKLSSNMLPGIHGDNGTPTVAKQSKQSSQEGGSGRPSGGPNTPDPMYSMDSLNVVGNNTLSITSSELPPSSISPENRRDPWVPSSFSDESLHTQCRNMSRLHKNFHNSDDDGSSSSTYESDSLNPEVTLSGMHSKTTYAKRETTPKPEVAEEATEELPGKPILIKSGLNSILPVSVSMSNLIDHSTITINGRKVSGCEETPLPLILASQKESKIGIIPVEPTTTLPINANGNYGTIKRGRMKSPPPPPPPAKSNGNTANRVELSAKGIDLTTTGTLNGKKEFHNSLNNLLCRNVYSSNRRSSIEIVDDKTVCGGEVNVIQTPLSQQAEINKNTDLPSNICNDRGGSKNEVETHKNKVARAENIEVKEDDVAYPSSSIISSHTAASSELTNQKISGIIDNTNGVGGKSADIPCTPTSNEGTLPGIDDDVDKSDTVIRPCELSTKTQNYTVAATQSVISANENNNTGINVSPLKTDSIADSAMSNDDDKNKNGTNTSMKPQDGIILGTLANSGEEMLFEENHLKHNKTELDCEDAQADASIITITTASHEIKPVSCATNGETLYKNEKCKESNTTDDKKVKMIDESELYINGENDAGKGEKISEIVQCNSSNNSNTKSALTYDLGENSNASKCDPKLEKCESSNKVKFFEVYSSPPTFPETTVAHSEQTFFSKFGNDVKTRGEVEAPVKPATLSPSPPISEYGMRDRSGENSKSSSRRGSSSSSIDFNAVHQSTNGLLNCNRLSLCSLPDNNEMEFEAYETVEAILENSAIQDQPVSISSAELIGVCISESGGCEQDTNEEDTTENDKSETIEVTQENSNPQSEKPKLRKTSTEEVGLVNALRNSLEGLIPMIDPVGRNILPKTNGQGHQRRLSMGKIDFENRTRGDFLASSVPTSSSTLEQLPSTRKGSFPELFINTENATTKLAKHLMGNEKNAINKPIELATKDKILVGNPFSDSLIGHSFDSIKPSMSSVPLIFNNKFSNVNEAAEISGPRSKSKPFANDFLQALGEIYATKSKLLTNKTPPTSTTKSPPISNAASLPNSPKEKDPPSITLISAKTKTGECSMDTIDGLDCQDRSISEYNISPRSARELISESLLNCSSLSSSLSQKSIGTIHEEVDEKIIFRAGVETQNNRQDVQINIDGNIDTTSPEAPKDDNLSVCLIQPKSMTTCNTATFKKKPTFIRGKGSVAHSLPCVDILINTSNGGQRFTEDDIKTENNHEKFPPPPPLPPLQYSHTTSDSSASASSSIGDTSEISEKSQVVSYSDRGRKLSNESRYSLEKNTLKSNGNVSSECSLIDLGTSNPKSIIFELKQAQAKKLKAMEQNRVETQTTDCPNRRDAPPEVFNFGTISVEKQKAKAGLDKNCLALDCKAAVNLLTTESTIETPPASKQPEDVPVKTIVNGKHTNSIIVNTPIVSASSEVAKKVSRSGAVQTTKFPPARPRGNIMSPSLSGNFTEMNGIDSETMGASSIHDDELSGQLQQKENHINELHGNVDEIQTTNKLDGASFRRVLSEYEKTLSMFIQQIDQLKQRMDEAETEKQTLIKERDQALEDLRNVESAFSDVHRKYERAKALLENMKSNEDTLIRRDQEMMQRIQNRDKKIDMIKDKAQESIEKMHLDYETRIKEMEFENAKLRALNRKNEMKLSTLENDVEQKAKENAQLSALCDELINGQVGQV